MVATPSLSAQFVQAAHTSSGSNLPINRIVIHGTVSRTFIGGAKSTAGYFQSAGSGGSAHYVVDPGTVVQCVAESVVAWHAPPNGGSLGIEMCDLVDFSQAALYDQTRFPTEAAWNARWNLPDFDAMLRLTADLTAELATKYRVPLVKIGAADLLAGRHGICGHIDVSQAWHLTDHHDPGTTFPWGRFLDYVTHPGKTLTNPGGGSTPTPAPTPTPRQDIDMGKPLAIKVGSTTALISNRGMTQVYSADQLASVSKWMGCLRADGTLDETKAAATAFTTDDVRHLREVGLTA